MNRPRDPHFRAASQIRVRYADTDAMGVVYYANYLAFFESARVEYIRAIGCSYREMEATGVVAAVTEAHAKYFAPARFDDLLTIYVRIERLRKASMTFIYEVWREDDGQRLTEGTTAHACLNRDTLRPTPLPEAFRAAVLQYEGPEVAL
ncbi:MAG: acyl-CoA thioesterase [Chloroflexota bacterium]